tara:strand:+ start:2274 stop:2765 length:492 start_codon:yes stop_codon:yes gene_type:complete
MVLGFFHPVFAESGAALFKKGKAAAKSGSKEFAFLYFREALSRSPKAHFSDDALFALGEYCLSLNNYAYAAKYFNQYISTYPKSDVKIFACSYLLSLAKIDKKEDLIKELEKEIVTFYNLSLLFSEFKEYNYRSAFSKKYKARYYIDRVEIYIDGAIATQISY